MSNQADGQGRKFFGMEIGTVADNADPKRIGRCRIRVPGICEPYSAWALPIGGGKGSNRGAVHTPDVGAEVSVWFKAGDPDHPYYVPSNWGAPDGEPEVPGPVGGYSSEEAGDDPNDTVSAADAYKVRAWEGDRFVVVADEREGKERLFVRDKKSDDQLLIDGVKYAIQLKASSLLHLKADGVVRIDGTSVVINGRTVAANGRPIR